jgi:hypothetical protein
MRPSGPAPHHWPHLPCQRQADSKSLDIPSAAADSWWHKDKFNFKLYRRTEPSIRSDYCSVFLCHSSRWLHVSSCKLNPISTNNAIWTPHICVSVQIHVVTEHNVYLRCCMSVYLRCCMSVYLRYCMSVYLRMLHVCFYKRRHSDRRRAAADDDREWVLEKIFGFKSRTVEKNTYWGASWFVLLTKRY